MNTLQQTTPKQPTTTTSTGAYRERLTAALPNETVEETRSRILADIGLQAQRVADLGHPVKSSTFTNPFPGRPFWHQAKALCASPDFDCVCMNSERIPLVGSGGPLDRAVAFLEEATYFCDPEPVLIDARDRVCDRAEVHTAAAIMEALSMAGMTDGEQIADICRRVIKG